MGALNAGCRDMDDEDRARIGAVLDPPANLEAIHVREIHIQENDGGFILAGSLQRLAARPGLDHLESAWRSILVRA